MPATMCDLAATLPLLIGRLLDREAKLSNVSAFGTDLTI